MIAPPSKEDADRVRRISDRLATRGLHEYVRQIMRDRHVLEGEILGRGKARTITRARMDLWRALHDKAGLSFPMIAEIFETRSDNIIHATSYQETRQLDRLEQTVIGQICAYVRGIGYGVLADQIESGEWRFTGDRCSGAPSCPHRGQKRLGGRCYEHRSRKAG